MAKDKLKSNSIKQDQERNTAYTNEELTKAWFKFTLEIPQLQDLHYIFNSPPNLSDDKKKIIISTNNTIVQERVNELIPQLKKYLANRLDNNTIIIESKIIAPNPSLMASTPKEKARVMAEKNPELRTLFIEWKLMFV